MYKVKYGSDIYNFIKHICINNIRFSIMQIKTRRTQKFIVTRWLMDEQYKELKPATLIDGIHIKTCYNVRDCLRAINAEAKTNAMLDMHIKLNPAKEAKTNE